MYTVIFYKYSKQNYFKPTLNKIKSKYNNAKNKQNCN